jgi:hypothetical protein
VAGGGGMLNIVAVVRSKYVHVCKTCQIFVCVRVTRFR